RRPLDVATAWPLVGDVAPARPLDVATAWPLVGDVAAAGPLDAATARPSAWARVGSVLEPAAELLALIAAWPGLPETVARRLVAIGHAAPMVDLVLPAIAVADVVAIEVAVDAGRAIGVDVDVAVAASIAPVPAAEHRAGRREAQSPHEAGR